MIRLLHAADLHLDSPFDSLPADKAALRRAEQRELLTDIVEAAEREGARLILLSGDLLDSAGAYLETAELLTRAFAQSSAEVFIAPGNHDHYSKASPYARLNLPDNVHIFKNPFIECVELPALGVRVWGAAFTSPSSEALLRGFEAEKRENTLDVMALHGEVGREASSYDPISEEELSRSGMDYVALGHIHGFSGLRRAGETCYAWPGCALGRGFDETGEKGVIIADVDEGETSLRFLPLGGRRYEVLRVELTGCADASAALAAAIPPGAERDIYRVVLCGEFDGRPDKAALDALCESRFFHHSIRDESVPRRDIWESAGDDSLRGLFVGRLKAAYDTCDSEDSRARIADAVRWGLAALDNGEDVWL